MARTNEALNKAIWTVLTTQFKKEAKEAFKMVQENGYEVSKNGHGTWTVTNPHTKKYICIEYGNYRTSLFYGNYTTQVRRWRNGDEERIVAEKFDFVKCLATSVNRVYYDKCYDEANRESKAKSQYQRIRNINWSIKYETDRIAKAQAEIARLQEEIIRATESKVKDEMRLKDVKKELGLVK